MTWRIGDFLRKALLVAPLAVVVVHAQPAGTALCEAIATGLRSHRTAPGDPLSTVSTGTSPILRPSGKPLHVVESVPWLHESSMDAFRERFLPAPPLVAAVEDFSQSIHGDIFGVPGGQLHAVRNADGTANCMSFAFFLARADGSSDLLPDPPRRGDRDGDNLVCDGYGRFGDIGRIGATDVYYEYSWSNTNEAVEFRIVPLHDGQWGHACYVNADYRSVFAPTHVFTEANGPVSAASLRAVVGRIVERWASTTAPNTFTYGPPVPARDAERMEMLFEAATDLDTDTAIPTFGSNERLDPTQDSTNVFEKHPIVLDGATYVMQIGRATMGWRIFSSTIVIVYTLDGPERLRPIASAVVEQKRGALSSVRVTNGR